MLFFKFDKQKGFTLIELVIVIVILGILAAMILPRFISLQTRARNASIKGMEGALLSASAIAHTQALAEGKDAVASETITLEGQSVNIIYGYPDGTASGIGQAASISSGFQATWGATPDAAAQLDLDPAVANCYVTYTPATASSPPTVVVTTSGCS